VEQGDFKNSYENKVFIQIRDDGRIVFTGSPFGEPTAGVVLISDRSYTIKFIDFDLVYVIDRITGTFTASEFDPLYDFFLKGNGFCVVDNIVQKF